MREILTAVVEEGTGRPARLNGYTAAGKTGTAQKIDPSRAYSHSHYVSSFVGFAPVQKPQVTILVSIDSPVGAIYGADVAAPAFKSVAEETLAYLDVLQDHPAPQAPEPSAVKQPRLMQAVELGSQDSNASSPEEDFADSAVEVRDSDSAMLPQATVLVDDRPALIMPNFAGMAVRRVAGECQEKGLDLSITGSGLAVEQNPPAGTRVAPGSPVRVRFAR